MNNENAIPKKTWAIYIGGGVVILIVVLLSVFQPAVPSNSSLKEQALSIWGDEVDFSNSLYPEEDYGQVREEIEETVDIIKASDTITVENVVELAREAKRVRDFNTAIALFKLAQEQNPEDKFFLIDLGNIYLELGQWENARAVFEPMKQTYPVYEAFLGLANAYKQIDDTPTYVIDDIYLESLQRHRFRFDVVKEYVEWLEETGREDQTIPYYKIMQKASPQDLLEKRIEELEQTYPNAPKEL